MSIKGVANFYKDRKRHIITTQTERASLPPLRCSLLSRKAGRAVSSEHRESDTVRVCGSSCFTLQA